MIRTKEPGEKEAFQEQKILIVPLLDLLFKETDYEDLIGLFLFYCHAMVLEERDQVPASTEYVRKTLSWSILKVQTVKKRLIDLGVLDDTLLRDANNRIVGRNVSISEGLTSLQAASATSGLGACTRIILTYNTHTLRKKNPSDCFSFTKKLSKKERSVKYVPMAEILSKIISYKKHIKHSPDQIKSWAYSILQMIEDQEIAPKRIKTVLDWYSKNIGLPYVPVVESGMSLKDKFVRLEDAMERGNSNWGKGSKPLEKVEYGETWYLSSDGEYHNDQGRRLM